MKVWRLVTVGSVACLVLYVLLSGIPQFTQSGSGSNDPKTSKKPHEIAPYKTPEESSSSSPSTQKTETPEEISRLIEGLGNADSIVRRKIGEKLVQKGKPAVKALLERLGNPQVKGIERLEIVNVLGRLRAHEAAEDLLRELERADPYLRSYVLVALGSTQNMVVFPALRDELSVKDPSLRLAAIKGLGELRSSEGADLLVAQFSRDQGPEGFEQSIHIETVKSLGLIADKRAVEPLVKELGKRIDLTYHLEVIEALVKIGDKSCAGTIRNYIDKLRARKPTDKRSWDSWNETIKKMEEKLAALEKN